MKRRTKSKPAAAAIIIAVIFFVVFAAGIYFFQFTEIGYRMSVPFRGTFEKIDENVYINKLDPDEADEAVLIVEMINESKERVKMLFTDMESESNTIIILCDDANTLSKLGGDHDTKTIFFPTLKNYISLSPDYFTVDVLSHELTHAELHTRLTPAALKKLPTWFDEGLAMQNDQRKRYNENAWEELTDNGKNVIPPEDMDEPSEFYAGSEEDTRPRYVCAKHEVGEWLDSHGQQGLLDLIDALNNGEDFYTAYNR